MLTLPMMMVMWFMLMIATKNCIVNIVGDYMMIRRTRRIMIMIVYMVNIVMVIIMLMMMMVLVKVIIITAFLRLD